MNQRVNEGLAWHMATCCPSNAWRVISLRLGNMRFLRMLRTSGMLRESLSSVRGHLGRTSTWSPAASSSSWVGAGSQSPSCSLQHYSHCSDHQKVPARSAALCPAAAQHRLPSHLSTPAHATMTPLSVQKRGGGQTSCSPRAAASFCSTCRTVLLAATPPATTKVFTSGCDSSAHLQRQIKVTSLSPTTGAGFEFACEWLQLACSPCGSALPGA